MEIKMAVIPGGKKGSVGKINVKAGAQVAAGDILAQVETGKGNRAIKAAADGVIRQVLVEEGSEVSSQQTMFVMEPQQASDSPETEPQQPVTGEQKTQEIDTELLIIGAGPGGYVAAIYAAKKGLKVTLVEKEELGGTCLNVGCIPTKALVKSSEVCHSVRHSSFFGIEAGTALQVNMQQIIRRKDEVKEKLISGIGYLMEKNSIQVIRGQASFLSDKQVCVTGEGKTVISAKHMIIATGSKISKVNIPGIELPFVMNSTDALSCTELPASITIIGGGVIGMEFAFIYRNLGVEVQVVEFMDRLLTMLDHDLSDELRLAAEQAGIRIHTGAKVTRIQRADQGQAIVTYETRDGEHLLVSEKVLVAIGREPNMDGLELDKAGIQLNERGRGIAVDSRMRTNVEHIYAIGDVTNILQLAHVASHQGITAVDAILGEKTVMHYTAVPNVIFTSPEIASVGLLERECREQGLDYRVSKVSFSSNGKALTMNEPDGFIKLIKDNPSGRIVGGAIIGPDAASLISALTLAIANGLTEEQIRDTIFAHPTTGEVLHEAAFGLGIGALHQA